MSGAPAAPGARWVMLPALPPLPPHTIHVWRMTATERLPPNACLPLLTSSEHERAGRLLFAEDREQFLACRATLRLLLSHYSGASGAREIPLSLGPHGKPSLNGSSLKFNLSHTRQLALFAFAHGIELGIDVEQLREGSDLEDVARHNFAPAERAGLRSLPPGDRAAAFYRCWTRKEALLKAEGCGLLRELQSFAVPVCSAEHGQVLPESSTGWALAHLEVAEDAPGALAWRNCLPAPQLMLFDLSLSLLPVMAAGT